MKITECKTETSHRDVGFCLLALVFGGVHFKGLSWVANSEDCTKSRENIYERG